VLARFFRRDVGFQVAYSRQSVDDAGSILFTDADFRYAGAAAMRGIGRF
jgi:hypothetical protein